MRNYESRYPVVYRFPTHEFRSSGPNAGPHDVGPDQILTMAEQGSDFKDQAEDWLEALLASIEAATSHDELDVIDVTTGWLS